MGVCLTTFVFAYRSGDLWGSPGKILALVFATMCLLNWALDLLAALVMKLSHAGATATRSTDNRGYIAGILVSQLRPFTRLRFRIAHPRLRDLQNQVGESVLAP